MTVSVIASEMHMVHVILTEGSALCTAVEMQYGIQHKQTMALMQIGQQAEVAHSTATKNWRPDAAKKLEPCCSPETVAQSLAPACEVLLLGEDGSLHVAVPHIPPGLIGALRGGHIAVSGTAIALCCCTCAALSAGFDGHL